MATALGKNLIFDMHPGETGAFQFPYQATNIEMVAITVIAIGDYREIRIGGDSPGQIDRFAEGKITDIGETEMGGR